MSAPKIDLIRQALSAAESSIKLARQLLSDVEADGGRGKPRPKELPGVMGMFDGQTMVTEKGERFDVPENYASKSILVVGDTLKLVGEGGDKRFKQIEHVKRHKTTGILAKKDGKWAVVTPEGSYRVLNASIDHFSGQVGDEVLLQLPANSLQTTWGAVENISKKGKEGENSTSAAPLYEANKPGSSEKTEAADKPQVKTVPASKQEAKGAEEKSEKALKEDKKPPETKPESKTEVKETRPKEEKPKPLVPPAAKVAPVEAKPPVTESKPSQAPPKPVPVEAKPAVVEPKPAPVATKAASAQAAEDELT